MDVFVCVFLLWLTTSTGTAQPGSGQGQTNYLISYNKDYDHDDQKVFFITNYVPYHIHNFA